MIKSSSRPVYTGFLPVAAVGPINRALCCLKTTKFTLLGHSWFYLEPKVAKKKYIKLLLEVA